MPDAPIHHGNQFRKVARHGLWYAIGNLLPKILAIVLVPLYTHQLTPEQYGIVGTLTAAAQALPFLIGLSLSSAYGRFYFLEIRGEEGSSGLPRLFSTHFWFIVAWGGAVSCVLLLAFSLVYREFVDVPFFPYIPVALAPVWFGQIAQIGATTLEHRLQARRVTLIRLGARLLEYAVILVMLFCFDADVLALLMGPACASMWLAVHVTWLLWREGLLRWTFDPRRLVRSLRYALPLIPSAAASWINVLSDRLILARYGPLAQVGVYTVANQVAGVMYVLIDAVTRVQSSITLSALAEDAGRGKELVREFVSFYMWAACGAFVGLALFASEIVLVLDDAYDDASQTIALLAAPFILGGLARPFTAILMHYERTFVISLAGILSAALNLGLNLWLIPKYGQIAAAVTTGISAAFFALWLIAWSQATDRVRVNWAVILVSLTAVGVCLLGGRAANDRIADWRLLVLTKLGLLFVYLSLTLLSGSVRRGIRQRLPQRWKADAIEEKP